MSTQRKVFFRMFSHWQDGYAAFMHSKREIDGLIERGGNDEQRLFAAFAFFPVGWGVLGAGRATAPASEPNPEQDPDRFCVWG
jgi:hypothetical protein